MPRIGKGAHNWWLIAFDKIIVLGSECILVLGC